MPHIIRGTDAMQNRTKRPAMPAFFSRVPARRFATFGRRGAIASRRVELGQRNAGLAWRVAGAEDPPATTTEAVRTTGAMAWWQRRQLSARTQGSGLKGAGLKAQG